MFVYGYRQYKTRREVHIMTQITVVDQTTYKTFIEYVIRCDNDDTKDFRVQADGTSADLQAKIIAKIQELSVVPPKSQVNNGDGVIIPDDVAALIGNINKKV